MFVIRRRELVRNGLIGGALGWAGLFAPRLAFAAAATEQRFVFIIQRGAADGLGTLAPLGDPAYLGLRGGLADDFAQGQKLDGMFTLHPALAQVGGLYRQGQALFINAVATGYRDRSHFDGQNVLETGGLRPYQFADGWLNRLAAMLPPADARALAISATIPAALRGAAPVASYAPSSLPAASDDLLARVSSLYADDAQLHPLWASALATKGMAGDLAGDKGRGAAATGKLAASLMQGPSGARIAMIETLGWDTHVNQRGRLAAQLTGLDAMIGALKVGLGAEWDQTLVLVATEFGRTAAANGTSGTDHGTASLAMLMGGRVRGGRVIADWPGLAPAQLYETRDLKPTASLDAATAGAVAEHFGLAPNRTMARLFPGGGAVAGEGLVRD